MNRRDVLVSLGTAAVSVAGCIGRNPDSTATTNSERSTPTPSRTPTPTASPSPTPTPEPSKPDHLHGLRGSTDPSKEVGKTYSRTFRQSAHGRRTIFELTVPGNLYTYAKNRLRTDDYGAYVADRYDDPYIESMAADLKDFGEENDLSGRVVVDHAVAVVQGMEYTSDKAGTGYNEYPKYPVETLVDRGGDCEDTSILMVSLLRKLGYDARLLLLPGDQHMAVTVRGDPSIEGTYYQQNNDRYYYLETTGSGWTVGELPPDISGSPAQLISPYSNPVLVFSWVVNMRRPGGIETSVVVKNMGTAVARTAQVQVDIEDKNERVVAQRRVSYPEIAPDQQARRTLRLSPPDDRPLRVRVGTLLGGTVHDISTSEFQNP